MSSLAAIAANVRYTPETSPRKECEGCANLEWSFGVLMPKVLVKRADIKPGEVLCQYCTARCCSYFALPMETPTERNDFENIRWFMLHGRVSVFVDSGTWFLCVFNKCDHLQPDNMCGIYETRPQICRDYSTDSCEYDNDGIYDQLFETPDQIKEYADSILPLGTSYTFSPEPMKPSEVLLPLA